MNTQLQKGDKATCDWFGHKNGSQVEITERMDDTDTESRVCYHVKTVDVNRPTETAWVDAKWVK